MLGATLERIPEWQFDVCRIENISGPAAEGNSYTTVHRRYGRTIINHVTFTNVVPGQSQESTGRSQLGGDFKAVTELIPLGHETLTHWHMEYNLPGGVFGSLFIDAIFRMTLKNYAANFKALAEGRPPPHPNHC